MSNVTGRSAEPAIAWLRAAAPARSWLDDLRVSGGGGGHIGVGTTPV